MTEENSLECPNCGKKAISKITVSYGVFINSKKPDGVCGNCGNFYWKHPQKIIPPIVFKSTKRKEEQAPKKLNWFEEHLEEEKKKRAGRQECNNRISPTGKSRD